MIKLFAAYLPGLRQSALLELLLYHLLHLPDFALLPQVDDTETGALLAGTTRTTASVRIILHIIRHAIVDNVRQVVHIQSSGCHIRSHEQLCSVLSEFLHGKVTLLLGEVTMQGICIITVANQVVGHLLCLHPGTTEDDGIDTWVEIHQTFQGQVLILGMNHIIDVVDVFSTLVAATHLNLTFLLQVVLGYTLYLLAHGRTEEERTVSFGNTFEDSVHLFLEAHRQHLVSLVQYHIPYL